jgi:hypothetical protein
MRKTKLKTPHALWPLFAEGTRDRAQTFGSKFLNPADLEHLRGGLRKAGL